MPYLFFHSYGAMLAAFMRFKYPNVIQGAVASSGPIFQLEGITKSDLYFQAATEVRSEIFQTKNLQHINDANFRRK